MTREGVKYIPLTFLQCVLAEPLTTIERKYIYVSRLWKVIFKQVHKKGGNIVIVEKAQKTRFGMSPKYSRYIGIVS